MKFKKSLAACFAFTALFVAGCSQQTSNQAGGSQKNVTVATDSDTAPFTFKEKDDFKGYDIDLVKAIFKDSKEYKVEFQTVPFSSILTGVDSGRYQLVANNINYNEERAQKYLFSDPVSLSNYAIVSKNGDLDSFDKLSGKTAEALPGSNYAQALENWNKEHPDKTPIQVNYVSDKTGLAQRLQNIENGKIDFILYDAISAKYVVKDQGLNLSVANLKDKVGSNKDGVEYFLFAKDKEGEELAQFVNKRIASLKKDGTMKKLSEQYFGGDFVSGLE
ncbi:transporter substrate-binding domain-containing protein [Streptococcus massiliensis]|uniref:Polar amino acid ABC uptake transporter substrate binding protein n=1 Tax=Streptococcus massiliensis TaxID=313439 RepID=A0A380L213_9STRE|nr:transporter substrate-binding domain-containing protein [Streptococcus massiliensis]SUN76610.1 polar amino acid ABC uptake transporter substrate binding protein [Streptococcus massiliensis]